MDFRFSAEQDQLRTVARQALAAQRPPVPQQLGWLDSGLTMVDRAILAEECGYARYPRLETLRKSWSTTVTADRALDSAEALGIARHAYDLSVGHAKSRHQFGRPIGSYQAVAFPIADSYARVEFTLSLTYRACWLIEAEEPGADHATAVALAYACAAAIDNCERAFQDHGALSITWNFPLHHGYRRALELCRQRGSCLADVAATLLGTHPVTLL